MSPYAVAGELDAVGADVAGVVEVAGVEVAGAEVAGAEVAGPEPDGLGVDVLRSLGVVEGPGVTARPDGCFVGSCSSALSLSFSSAGKVTPLDASVSSMGRSLFLFDFVWSGDAVDVPGVLPSAGSLSVASRAPPATKPAAAATPSDRASARGEIDPVGMFFVCPRSRGVTPQAAAASVRYVSQPGVEKGATAPSPV